MGAVQLAGIPIVAKVRPEIERRDIPPSAARAVRQLARTIVDQLTSPLDPRLPQLAETLLNALPPGVAPAFRPPAGLSGAAIVRGLEISEADAGPTPPDWQHAGIHELDVVMLLLARCAGKPFAWQGQQDGRLVNNIVPAAGHEQEQTGASSTVLLAPHTEDAFHPARANLLLLGCLRNHDRIGTTVSSVRYTALSASQRRTLAIPAAPILPDVSYGSGYVATQAPAVSVLWENPDEGLTLRYDPAYTPLAGTPAAFQDAYAHLGRELERVSLTVALAPGEIMVLDNDVAVHGRVPFTARYDGADRWLKRVNVRLPQRRRSPAEADESGYGQIVLDPYATTGNGAGACR